MDWKFLVETLGSLGVGAATLVYLAKALLKIYLDRDIERYKATLRAEHDTAIERLRADLRIVAFEHEIRFAKLHEKRGEVIDELYRRLHRLGVAIDKLVFEAGILSNPEMEEKVIQAGNEFRDFLFENRIYFEEQLCDQLESFNRQVHTVFASQLMQHLPDFEGPARAKQFETAVHGVTKLIPELRKEIEGSFRTLLGIPIGSKPPSASH